MPAATGIDVMTRANMRLTAASGMTGTASVKTMWMTTSIAAPIIHLS